MLQKIELQNLLIKCKRVWKGQPLVYRADRCTEKGHFCPLPGHPSLCPGRSCGTGTPARMALTEGSSSALSGCFKTDLWENRHNLPCDIFLLGTSPVNPHASPQLRPGKGAQSGHRTHVPARWLLAQQLKPICFPSLVLSWFLMPELQDQPSCRRQLCSGCSQSLLLLLREFRMYKKRATTTR